MTAVTRALARYAATTAFDTLPARVRHEGVRAFVNWVGCCAGGAHEPSVECVLSVLQEFNGAPTATLVGRSERLDALNAAFINSMSSAALTFNDTHFATVAHPTSPVAAALLALAERQPISGRDFITALVLGIEIQCRVGNVLCTPPAQCAVGLSTQGLLGVIGAAVAAAKVLGLDEHGIAVAIGHAGNQSAGLREAHGTMGALFIPGNAGRAGLFAALLAAAGMTCTDTYIEGVKGFAVSFSQHPNLAAATDKLGESFEISTLAYKPYPSGFVVHPIADACLEIARRESYDPSEIERVELTVNPLAIQLTNRPDPQSREQALVSFPHWAAVALITKAAGVAQARHEVIADPAVRALRHKVMATASADIGRESAVARVILRDGRTFESKVQDCRGSARRPLTDDDITDKTRGQLCIVFDAARTQRILDAVWSVDRAAQVGALAGLLAAGG